MTSGYRADPGNTDMEKAPPCRAREQRRSDDGAHPLTPFRLVYPSLEKLGAFAEWRRGSRVDAQRLWCASLMLTGLLSLQRALPLPS